jgi:hypothetical protein
MIFPAAAFTDEEQASPKTLLNVNQYDAGANHLDLRPRKGLLCARRVRFPIRIFKGSYSFVACPAF